MEIDRDLRKQTLQRLPVLLRAVSPAVKTTPINVSVKP